MIEAILEFGNEIILIKVDGNRVMFGNTIFGARLADIKGLKLDYAGVCRQFPDLELDDDWREKAIKRFKEKIDSFKSEKQKIKYLVEDLVPHGYRPLKLKKKGFRHEKWK